MKRKTSQSVKNKTWYNRYRNALRYFGIDIKQIKNPTAKHVSQAKAQWQGTRKEMQRKGWVDLPTVYQASKMVEEKPKIENTYSDYITTYIPQLVSQIESKDYHEIQKYESGRRAVGELDNYKQNILDILAWGRAKVGNDQALAKAISSSPFVERAMNTIEYYTRSSQGTDAVTYIEDTVTPILEQAIEDAINQLED